MDTRRIWLFFRQRDGRIPQAYLKVRRGIRRSATTSAQSEDLNHTLRYARILMNVGLFWFFIQARAEKAGYLKNPHSNDEIDLPFEFAGTMPGFWMARVLTEPYNRLPKKFRSTFLIDFLSSGVMGLLYTLTIVPNKRSSLNFRATGKPPNRSCRIKLKKFQPKPIGILNVIYYGL